MPDVSGTNSRAPVQLPGVTKGPSAAPCGRGGSGSAALGQGEAPAQRRDQQEGWETPGTRLRKHLPGGGSRAAAHARPRGNRCHRPSPGISRPWQGVGRNLQVAEAVGSHPALPPSYWLFQFTTGARHGLGCWGPSEQREALGMQEWGWEGGSEPGSRGRATAVHKYRNSCL